MEALKVLFKDYLSTYKVNFKFQTSCSLMLSFINFQNYHSVTDMRWDCNCTSGMMIMLCTSGVDYACCLQGSTCLGVVTRARQYEAEADWCASPLQSQLLPSVDLSCLFSVQ